MHIQDVAAVIFIFTSSLCFSCQARTAPKLSAQSSVTVEAKKDLSTEEEPPIDEDAEVFSIESLKLTTLNVKCAYDQGPRIGATQARILCGAIDSKTKKKAIIGDLVKDASFVIEGMDDLDPKPTDLTGDPVWHKYFTLNTGDPDTIELALSTANVVIQGKLPEKMDQPGKLSRSLKTLLTANTSKPNNNPNYTLILGLAMKGQPIQNQDQFPCVAYSSTEQGFQIGYTLANGTECYYTTLDANGSDVPTKNANFLYIVADPTITWGPSNRGRFAANGLILGEQKIGTTALPEYLCRAMVTGQGLLFGKALDRVGCKISVAGQAAPILVDPYEYALK